jgi:hypothetical protein
VPLKNARKIDGLSVAGMLTTNRGEFALQGENYTGGKTTQPVASVGDDLHALWRDGQL